MLHKSLPCVSDEMLQRKIEIKTRNMKQLAEHREYLRQNPRLTYLFIELTDQCNLSCLHCGSNCSTANSRYIDTDLIIKTLREVAEDFIPSGVMICLTGGEPLLHPDFFKIVETITALGFPWGLTTNGTLIDQNVSSRFKKLGLSSVTISIDGLKETHERFRRQKGCFERTIRAIDYLKQENIKVQVTTVIHKDNFRELEPLYALMCDLGIYSWRVVNLEPIGRALQSKDILLSHKEFFDLLDFIREKRYSVDTPMDVRFGCSHYLSFSYEHEVRDNYFLCGAGIYVGSILCNGDIYSCLDIERRQELIQGNINQDRFSDVWFHKFREFRADRSRKSAMCQGCKERLFCNADSMHTWNFEKQEPFFCVLKEDHHVQ